MRRALVLSFLVLAWSIAPSAQGQSKPRRRAPPPVVQAPVVLPKAASTPIRSVFPSPIDPGPTCRAQCSKDRYSCHVEDDASDCNGRWLTCLSTCRTR